MAGNTVRSFRNRITGVVEDYPESLADAFDYLELVDEDAKTLINPPRPPKRFRDTPTTRKPSAPRRPTQRGSLSNDNRSQAASGV